MGVQQQLQQLVFLYLFYLERFSDKTNVSYRNYFIIPIYFKKKNLKTFIILYKNDMENVSNNDDEDDHYKDEKKYRASATKKEQP